MKTTMKQWLNRVIPAIKSSTIILSFTLVFISCSKDDDVIPLNVGANAPEFTLKSLAGTNVSLSDFDNKVVVLFFFGNNCPSCKAVAPNVESTLVTPFASNTDYMVLGLDQWNGNAASVEAFKTATGVTFPLLLNASTVASDYKTTFDRIVVIDKSGKIAFSGKQSAASDIAAAKAKVMELISPVTPVSPAPSSKLSPLNH
jgi:peroxiredoxin